MNCLCHPSLKNFDLSYTYNKYTKKLKCNRYNSFLLKNELIKEVEINKRDLDCMNDNDLLKLFEFVIFKTDCPLHINCDLNSKTKIRILLIETFQAGIKLIIDFKHMMQLQQFKQFHDLLIHVANLKLAIIVIGSFHGCEKYSES